MDALEVIFSIVGILIYWFLTNRKSTGKLPDKPDAQTSGLPQQPVETRRMPERLDKPDDFEDDFGYDAERTERKPFQLPDRVEPAQNLSEQRVKERALAERRAMEANRRDEPQRPPATFKELFEQFTQPQRQAQVPRQPVPEWQEDYDEHFEPLLKKPDPSSVRKVEERGIKRYEMTDHSKRTVFPKLKLAEDLEESRSRTAIPRKVSRYKELFKNPQTVRDMFVMKEIFDRKEY